MLEMYKGMVNSPETTITNDINAEDTIIYVLDERRVPEPPNLMTLGTGTSAETVKVLEINGNALTVERGFQGVARSWSSGTVIARNFTEYDYNALIENIKTLKTKTDTNADDILDLMSYIGDLENLDTIEKANLVLALNEIYQELAAHKAEIATQTTLGHVKAGQNITIDSDGTINANVKGGNVDSVNGKTGEVILSASDVGAVPTSRRVNNKALTSDITINVSDISGLVSSILALGQNASAAGNFSVALGRGASAAGNQAVALGRSASATKLGSVALGDGATAEGNQAVALGLGAEAQNANEGILGDTGTSRTSKWKVPGDFTVSGTKNFEIPHPKPEKKATHVIRHGAVESPTPGDTLYRYKITATKDNDLVTIDLPDYFIYLNKDVQIWVTGQGHFGNGYGTLNRETEQLEIHCQFAGEYNVLVIGTRNDDHPSVQEWSIKGVEREIGESWTGETYVFSVDEILEVEEFKEVSA